VKSEGGNRFKAILYKQTEQYNLGEFSNESDAGYSINKKCKISLHQTKTIFFSNHRLKLADTRGLHQCPFPSTVRSLCLDSTIFYFWGKFGLNQY
jgi:hypothetical protein